MESKVKTEIDDMLKELGELGSPEEEPPASDSASAPAEEAPVEETPTEEKPEEEKPEGPKGSEETPEETPKETPKEPPAETPPAETPPAEPPTEETPPTPPAEETPEQRAARLEAQNAKLIERIEELSGASATPAVPTPEGKPPAESKPEPKPDSAAPAGTVSVAPQEIAVDEVDFLQGRDPNDLLDNPTEFNKLLNVVYRKGVEAGVPLAMERSLLAVPQVVVSQIQRSNVMKGLVDDFYKANEDLKPVRRTVGLVANEVHSEHPDWTVQQVFDEAALRTRKVLGMPERPAPTPTPTAPPGAPPVVETSRPGDPAFANVRGSRQRGPATPKLTGMAKEIEELM